MIAAVVVLGSLFATLLSTISYLGYPGEMIKHGPVILMGFATMPVIYFVVGYCFIPTLMRQPITSAYELLELRLGVGGRLLGAIIFMVTRLVWMALLLFLSAKAMTVMLDWPATTIPFIIVVLGVIAIAYTALGGIKAVMITDVVQFFILLAGAALTVIFITIDLGAVKQWFPTHWLSNWDTQPLVSFDPTVRVTMVGSMIAYGSWWICTAVSDQVAIQRYLVTRNAKEARKAFLINNVSDIVVALLLAMVGLALLAFFSAKNIDATGAIQAADGLFPRYIAGYLPVGVSGIVIAAILSAAMSSVDSGINSVVTVFTIDVLPRFKRLKNLNHNPLLIARWVTLAFGIWVILTSCMMGQVPGNIIEVTTKTNGLFVGPLAGLFIMALFIPFANGIGAAAGALAGLIVAVLIAYWDLFTGGRTLSFQWIIPAALVAHIGVGCMISVIVARLKTTSKPTH